MADANLHNSLVKWINSFEGLSYKLSSFGSLHDGVILFEILSQIDPATWPRSAINYNATGDWALCEGNLKKLYAGLLSFYEDKLEQSILPGYVDLHLIAAQEDAPNLALLLELIIGAVVQCEEKDRFIAVILALDENTQASLMKLIEKVMENKEANESVHTESSHLGTQDMQLALDKAEAEKVALQRKVKALEEENLFVKKHNNQLLIEKDDVEAKLREALWEQERNTESKKEDSKRKLENKLRSNAQLEREIDIKEQAIFGIT